MVSIGCVYHMGDWGKVVMRCTVEERFWDKVAIAADDGMKSMAWAAGEWTRWECEHYVGQDEK